MKLKQREQVKTFIAVVLSVGALIAALLTPVGQGMSGRALSGLNIRALIEAVLCLAAVIGGSVLLYEAYRRWSVIRNVLPVIKLGLIIWGLVLLFSLRDGEMNSVHIAMFAPLAIFLTVDLISDGVRMWKERKS